MFCSWNLTPSQIVCFGLVSWLRSARSVTKWSNVSWLILRLHCHYLCLQPYSFLEYISKYMRTRSLWTWMDELKWTCKEATKRASWCFSNNTVWDFQTARFNKSLTPKSVSVAYLLHCSSGGLDLSVPETQDFYFVLSTNPFRNVRATSGNTVAPKDYITAVAIYPPDSTNIWLEWIIYTAKYVL